MEDDTLFGEYVQNHNRTWCSSAKREISIISLFTFLLCHSNHKNITRIAHSNREKITPKSTLECTLDHDEYLTRASRSNAGTHHVRRIQWELEQIASRAKDLKDDSAMKETLDGVKDVLQRRLESTMRRSDE